MKSFHDFWIDINERTSVWSEKEYHIRNWVFMSVQPKPKNYCDFFGPLLSTVAQNRHTKHWIECRPMIFLSYLKAITVLLHAWRGMQSAQLGAYKSYTLDFFFFFF